MEDRENYFVLRHMSTCEHPTRSVTVEYRSHLTYQPGELCTLELFGPVPVVREDVRYIFMCFDLFTKHTRLYALHTANTGSV